MSGLGVWTSVPGPMNLGTRKKVSHRESQLRVHDNGSVCRGAGP